MTDKQFKLTIDNAQKELKEELQRQINTREIEEKFIEKNFISKDKIKEKIKEQKEMSVDGEVFKTAVNYTIKILKEILEC